MIEQLTIDGYKSIRHQLIPLKPMNVLAGLNSSGKSSVIQTLQILGRIAQRKEEILPEHCGDEDTLRNKNEKQMELTAIYGDEGENTICYSKRQEQHRVSPQADPSPDLRSVQKKR